MITEETEFRTEIEAPMAPIVDFCLQVNGSDTIIELIDGKALYVKKGDYGICNDEADRAVVSQLTDEIDVLCSKLSGVIERLQQQ